jgi:hypothetical protein
MYLCGGYVGGTPGPHTDACLVFDHSKAAGGTQWSSITKLPNTGRAGGGMVYDAASNALYYAAGATRVAGTNHATDHNSTWKYSFDAPNDGWIPKAVIPFKGNHISFVTTKDSQGRERHYFSGGQREENEYNGNNDDHYEYIVANDTWVKRQSLPMPRGHASSSTRAHGCGYLVIGGCTNGGQHLSDVTYYSVETDSWVKIGALPEGLNTPVCDINRNTNMLHCETGYVSKGFSFKRQISL